MKLGNNAFENPNEIMKQINNFCSKMNSTLKDFLGFDIITFEVLEDENNEFSIHMGIKDFYLPFIVQTYEELFNIIHSNVDKMIISGDFNNIQKFIENTAFSSLLDGKLDESNFSDFVDELKELSYMTYEGTTVDIGIYIANNKESLELFKTEKEFEFIEINPISIKKLMIEEKPLLKLINNIHFNFIVNWDFKVVGIIKKKSFKASLREIHDNIQMNMDKKSFIKSTLREIEISFKNQFETNYLEKMFKYFKYDFSVLSAKNKSEEEYFKNMNVIFHEVYLYIKGILEDEISKIEKSRNTNSALINALFINVKDKELYLWNNNYYSLLYKKGKWKLTNDIYLAHEIKASKYINEKIGALTEDSIYPNITGTTGDILRARSFEKIHKKNIKKTLMDKIKQIEVDTDAIFKLISIISKMSNNKIGGLFVIITNEDYFKDNIDNIFSDRDSDTIYHKL